MSLTFLNTTQDPYSDINAMFLRGHFTIIISYVLLCVGSLQPLFPSECNISEYRRWVDTLNDEQIVAYANTLLIVLLSQTQTPENAQCREHVITFIDIYNPKV